MPPNKDPLRDLSPILATLGQTPDEVAEVLRANGCRGFQSGNYPSPVIRYVYRQFDEGTLVLVYSHPTLKPSKLLLYTLDGRTLEVLLPVPVADFLALFDDGAYPDLDLESERPVA